MQNKNFDAKSLVQMSLMVAMSIVLIVINANLPLFNSVINFILPIPMAYVYIKYDLKKMIFANVAVLVLSCMLVTPIVAVSFSIMIFISSLVLGFCFRRKISSFKIILFMAVGFIIITILQFIITVNIVGGSDFSTYINDIVKMFQSSLEEAKKIYISNGVSKSQIDTVVEPLEGIFTKKTLLTLIPALLILSALINAYITEIITVGVLKRLRIEVPKTIKFYELHMHNLVLAFGIIVACIGALLDKVGIAIGVYIYTTAFIVGQILLLICGISLVVYYLKNKSKMKNGVIVLIIILTLLISVVMYMYVFLGLMDTFADFRKIERNRINKKTGE